MGPLNRAPLTAGTLDTAELLMIKDEVARVARELGRWAQDQSRRHHLGEAAVEVDTKTGAGDFVTSVDVHVQERLVQELSAAYPSFGFLGEEEQLNRFDASNPVWVLDPVDGTHNFVRAYPGFCVSVGLVHEDASLLGVIYDAATDAVFWAVANGGAWREENGQDERLTVSAKSGLTTAMITTGFTATSAADPAHIALFADLIDAAAGTRVSGSACRDLCFVAAGKVDLFWQFHIMPWDVAAGRLLVTEAGGRVELEVNAAGFLSGKPLVVFAGAPAVVEEALTRRGRIVNA